jgi:spermidine synthase
MSTSPSNGPTETKRLFVLLTLFVGSGAAALIYEVVWYHLLRFTIGSSTLSLGILLACFMGGLFLGSLWFHKAVSPHRNPLKVYALLELGIGFFGILMPVIMPAVTELYVSSAERWGASFLLRAVASGLLLLPPTILMGATLPAISRWMKLTSVGYSRIGALYSANIAGAVLGTLLAGFYLLRSFDVYVATAVAVILNLLIAAAGYALGARTRFEAAEPPRDAEGPSQPRPTVVYVAIGLSGLTALGAQVVWTRLLSLLLGTTVYNFAAVLAVFLVGLGAGSALGARHCRRTQRPLFVLGLYQLGLIFAIPYAAFAITRIIPSLELVRGAWLATNLDDLLRVAVAILPATLCWGASFPLAVAAAGRRHRDPGALVGAVYAANTIGAILGALAFSTILISGIGTRSSQLVLTSLAGLSVLVILTSVPLSIAKPRDERPAPLRANLLGRIPMIAAVLAVSVGLGLLIPDTPAGLIGYGPQVKRWNEPAEYVHVKEGTSASVAVSRTRGAGSTRDMNLHINGQICASNLPQDMRLQRMLGHLPAMLHPEPKSVLIIGFGAGVTAGCFTRYPSIERIVIVEIEPEVPAASGHYFRAENYEVLEDPRTELIIDDGRHYLTTTRETFDLITTDPFNPWAKGAAALATREFLQLCAQHLNPGGFISQWVPLYQMSEAAVRSQLGTFLEVFPEGSIWSNDIRGQGYDLVLLGQVDPLVIDSAQLQSRLDGNALLQESLADVKITSPVDLLRAYAGRRRDVRRWLGDYQPNLDRNLRLEYLAGRARTTQQEQDIYENMTRGLAYPEGFFRVGPEEEGMLNRFFDTR